MQVGAVMKQVGMAFVALALTMVPVEAAAPSAEQKADFYRTCVATSQNEPLCTCKADAAVKLVDGEFMAVIIASMSGRTLDPKYNVAYNDYIVESTRACGMGM